MLLYWLYITNCKRVPIALQYSDNERQYNLSIHPSFPPCARIAGFGAATKASPCKLSESIPLTVVVVLDLAFAASCKCRITRAVNTECRTRCGLKYYIQNRQPGKWAVKYINQDVLAEAKVQCRLSRWFSKDGTRWILHKNPKPNFPSET